MPPSVNASDNDTTVLSSVFDTDEPHFLSDLFQIDNVIYRPNQEQVIGNVPVRRADEIPNLMLDYGQLGAESSQKLKAMTSGPEQDVGCSFDPPSAGKVLAGAGVNSARIAEALGLDSECVISATTNLGNEVPKNWWESLVGTNAAQIDGNMNSTNCGDFSTSLNTIFNEMSSLKCQMSKTVSDVAITFNSSSRIKIMFVAPDPRTRDGIQSVTDSLTRQVEFYMRTQPNVRDYFGLPIEYFNAALSAWRSGFNELTRTLDSWLKDNPISITIRNTTINAKIANLTTLFVSTDMDTDTEAAVIMSVENIATETAIQKIQEALGLNSMPPNARTYIESQVANQTTSRQDQILSQINQNSITVNADDEIYLEIQGSVSNSVINASIENQYDIKVHTAMKSSMSIGETVASNIVAGIKIEQDLITESKGLEDPWKDVLDTGTERLAIRKKASSDFWGGLFASGSVVMIVGIIVAAIAAYYYMQSQSPGGAIKKFTGFGRRYR